MNILVTGANGQLGRCIKDIHQDSKHTFFFTGHEDLDITNQEDVYNYIKLNNINVIINCAAYTNVDGAEHDVIGSNAVNTLAVKYLADAIKSVNGYMIHISTDYVYPGEESCRPLFESSWTRPLSQYGKTKLLGEGFVNENKNNIIIRTSWLYSEYGKNFLRSMVKLTSEKEKLGVIFDQIGTPTYARDLANLIVNYILECAYPGLYHYSNEGCCSWYDFAKEICNQIGNDKKCKIIPIHSYEYKCEATRPYFTVLDKTKIKRTYNIEIPYWKDSVTKCLENLRDIDFSK